MQNVTKILHDEMRRMARKEIRLEAKRVRAESVAMRKSIRELKREVAELRESLKAFQASAPSGVSEIGRSGATPISGRFSSDSIRRLRKRLEISQRELAILVGVSSQAVYLWECKGGKLRLRNETRRILTKIKGTKKRDIRRQLDILGA